MVQIKGINLAAVTVLVATLLVLTLVVSPTSVANAQDDVPTTITLRCHNLGTSTATATRQWTRDGAAIGDTVALSCNDNATVSTNSSKPARANDWHVIFRLRDAAGNLMKQCEVVRGFREGTTPGLSARCDPVGQSAMFLEHRGQD